MKRKTVVILVLAGTIMLSVAATTPRRPPSGEYKNLQVLPANTSTRLLTKIMVDGFTDELGVSCNFCHAENKDTHQPDYASDEKPEKQIARAMMRMTIDLNRKYFELENHMIGDSIVAVSCGTCHRGQAQPDKQ